MPKSNAHSIGKEKRQGTRLSEGKATARELVLHGDVSGLTNAFARSRRLITCPVSGSIHKKLQNHPGGISRFFEEAVSSFDGDLNALVEASVAFVDTRRFKADSDPPRNASGRVLQSTFNQIQRIKDALSEIRGMSRAKVLAGLVQLYLSQV